jgi:ApaG protein
MNGPFENLSQNFRITVRTEFDFDQSNPIQFQYLFRYTITIKNEGEVAAQLLSRQWHIKDAKEELRLVEGPGVIGQQPHFNPGEEFTYSSFCPLPTLTGEMWGHFNMINNYGQAFKIETPVFKFKVPEEFIDSY